MKILALPRDPNPYQRLLYGELAARGAAVRYVGDLTPSRTLNLLLLPLELAAWRARGWTVLHLHWVFGFRFPGGLRRAARAWFGLVLRVARLLRLRVVWTAHNTVPHERVFDDDVAARRTLVDASDLVIAHSASALEALERLGARPRRSAIVPHGPFEPPAGVPAPALDGARRLLFFGRVARYKGVEDLLVAARGADVAVTIAGECADPALRDELTRLAAPLGDRVELRLERIPDEEVAPLFAACDAVVLPFREVTTSGSALLAMSYGRAVLLPDLPAFRELPDDAVVRYAGLGPALADLAARPADELRRIGAAASEYAGGLSWSDSASLTLEALGGCGAPDASDGLVRNASYLMANTLLGAGFGFVFTTCLTRLFAPGEVGLVTTALAAATLVTSLSGLGLNYAIVRFLPEAGDRDGLINAAITLVGLAAVAVAAGLLVIPPATGRLYALGGSLFVVAFLAGNAVISLKALVETVFVADRDARAIFWSNCAGHVVRVALVFALSPFGPLGAYVAQPLGLGVALVLLGGHLRGRSGWRPRAVAPLRAMRPLLGFAGGSYVSTLVGGLPALLLPLIVLARFGAEQAAAWNIAMMVALLVFSLPSSLGQSLFAEGANSPERQRGLVRRSTKVSAAVMLPAVAIGVAAAPLLLQIFGRDYESAGLPTMRLLILSGLLVAANFVTGTVLFLEKEIRTIVVINLVNLAVVLVVALVFASDISGVAAGWLLGECVNVVLFTVAARRTLLVPRYAT